MTKPDELRAGALVLASEGKGIVVSDRLSRLFAEEWVRRVTILAEAVAAWFEPMEDAAKASLQSIRQQKEVLLGPVEAERKRVRGECARQFSEEERVAREEQAKALVEAKRIEEERRKAEANALAAAGRKVEAKALLRAPVEVIAPRVEATRTADGANYRTVWKYEITDDGLVPREFCSPDNGKVGGYVRAGLAQAKPIPGVRAWQERVQATRR